MYEIKMPQNCNEALTTITGLKNGWRTSHDDITVFVDEVALPSRKPSEKGRRGRLFYFGNLTTDVSENGMEGASKIASLTVRHRRLAPAPDVIDLTGHVWDDV
jgi:hypothetical protein